MDKYNILLQENKKLQKEIDSKFSTEMLDMEQDLLDSKNALGLLEAKNKQLEKSIEQLSSRL